MGKYFKRQFILLIVILDKQDIGCLDEERQHRQGMHHACKRLSQVSDSISRGTRLDKLLAGEACKLPPAVFVL